MRYESFKIKMSKAYIQTDESSKHIIDAERSMTLICWFSDNNFNVLEQHELTKVNRNR